MLRKEVEALRQKERSRTQGSRFSDPNKTNSIHYTTNDTNDTNGTDGTNGTATPAAAARGLRAVRCPGDDGGRHAASPVHHPPQRASQPAPRGRAVSASERGRAHRR